MILGIHVSRENKLTKKKRTLPEAILLDTKSLGINAVQIFVANPHTGVPGDFSADITRDITHATRDIDLSVHSAYVDVSVWRINETNCATAKMQNILVRVKKELEICNKIKANCFVLHITKIEAHVVSHALTYLLPLAKQFNVKIGLEMVASRADPLKTYETPEKLDSLIDKIIAEHGADAREHFGIVVDTAHIWSAGVNVRDAAVMTDWLNRMRHASSIILFHLNGSLREMGCGRDAHAIPFCEQDKIWHDMPIKETGAYVIIKFAIKNKIPMICEMNVGTEAQAVNNLSKIMELE